MSRQQSEDLLRRHEIEFKPEASGMRLLQFRLRTLLLIVTLSGIGVALYQQYVGSLQRQREACLKLLGKGVKIQWRPAKPAWLHPLLQSVVDRSLLQDAVTVSAERCLLRDEDLAALKDLPRLERLYLASNPISDRGLPYLQGLQRLERLSLWGTKISDEGVRCLGNIKSLTVLDIHDPQRYVSLGSSALAQPMSLALGQPSRDYRLTSDCLRHLSGAKNLRALYFTFSVDDEGLAALARLPNLRLRTLALQNVTGAGMAHLSRWGDLEAVHVERGKLGRDGLQSLSRLPKLRWLFLDRVQAADTAWLQIRDLSRLEQLSLNGSSISDAALASIAGLSRLTHLSLRATPVTDRGVAHLKRLTRMRQLDLLETWTTADCLQYLTGMSQLQRLAFRAPLDDDAVRWLAELPSLAYLSGPQLHSTCDAYVTDAGLAELAKLCCLGNVILHDACDGSRLPGIGFPAGPGRMTDDGISQLWSEHCPQSVALLGRDLTAAGLRWSPELSRCSRLVVRSPRGSSEVITQSLPIGGGAVELGDRRLAVMAEEGLGPRQVEFQFGQPGSDLGVFRYVPTARHLKVNPNTSRPMLIGGWHNLRHVTELESFETPGSVGSGVLVDATGIYHLGSMKNLRNLVLDLPPDLSAEDFSPLARLDRLEALDLWGLRLSNEHLRTVSQMSGLQTLRVFCYPQSVDEQGLGCLRSLTKLQELWLYGISDAGMVHVAEIKSLVRLSINGSVTDEGSRHLDQLPLLAYLDARWTSISDARLEELNRRPPKLYARTDR